MTEFGLTLPQRGTLFGATTMAELLDLARIAEDDGFTSVWVGDSILAKPRPDSLTLLGALAGVTRRVRLGVGCMASFPLRHPIEFAHQWATLDMVSGGRMALAVCTGIVKQEDASNLEGIHWNVRDGQRAGRMEEHIEACRLLWSGDTVSFAGRFTRFDDVRVEPTPVQQPCPIWIAANPFPGPAYDRALQRVARLADGWMTVRLFPGMLQSAWASIAERLAGLDRDTDAFPRLAYHNVNIDPSKEVALGESARFLDAYYGPTFSPSMVEAWTAAGPPEECAQHLRDLVAEGATDVALRITSWDQRGQYERLVSQVLPLVTNR